MVIIRKCEGQCLFEYECANSRTPFTVTARMSVNVARAGRIPEARDQYYWTLDHLCRVPRAVAAATKAFIARFRKLLHQHEASTTEPDHGGRSFFSRSRVRDSSDSLKTPNGLDAFVFSNTSGTLYNTSRLIQLCLGQIQPPESAACSRSYLLSTSFGMIGMYFQRCASACCRAWKVVLLLKEFTCHRSVHGRRLV